VRILIACEYSARVRDAFRDRGHDAWSADLLPTEGDPRWHIRGDVLPLLGDGWDLLIAHPPCTRLCLSGVRWLAERNLWAELDEACKFFRAFLDAPIPRIAVENPQPHRYAVERIGRSYDFAVQPWQFGEPYTKRTCFWTKGLPPLSPTGIVTERRPAVHHASPGPDRWKERSRTYDGLAQAMAKQWGGDFERRGAEIAAKSLRNNDASLSPP
jgi:hypothetical protein